ncbi:MAG: S16 family serine protease, partial [Candidatus Wenzhouxiangella sp. M2_3B_020]
ADEGEDHVTAVHVHDAVDRLLPTRPADAGADATRLRFPGRQPQPGQAHACGLELDGDLAFGQLIRVQAAVAADRDMRIVFEGTRTRDRATEIRVQATLAGVLGIDRMIGIHAFIGCAGVPGGNPSSQGPGTLLGTVVALLSRLADVPLRQDLALIGQLESDGRLTAVSGINERIEDAFAVAQRDSARGNAGVIVPAVQREGLMLRPELIKAVGNDLFQVLVAGNLAQVLELLIGTSPGTWRDGRFTPDSLFDRARKRLLADAD